MADTVAAYLALLGAGPEVTGQTLNAGSGWEISIGDLVRLIAEVMGRDVEPVDDPQRIRPAGSEVMRLVCDSTALQAVTDWKPQHTLEQGLSLTAEWFCDPANLAHYKVDQYNT